MNADYADQHQFSLTPANMNKPGGCIKGLLPVSRWRSPFDERLIDPQLPWCAEDPDDPRAVRSARSLPCAENPDCRAPTWLCRE